MRRRRYLASLGTGLLAGCVGGDEPKTVVVTKTVRATPDQDEPADDDQSTAEPSTAGGDETTSEDEASTTPEDDAGRGATWAVDTEITEAASHGVDLSDADAHGNVHIVWSDDRFGAGGDLLYAKVGPGGEALISEHRLTQTAETKREPRLVVDDQSNLHIVWLVESDLNVRLMYMKTDDRGNHLVEPKFVDEFLDQGRRTVTEDRDEVTVRFGPIAEQTSTDRLQLKRGPHGFTHLLVNNGLHGEVTYGRYVNRTVSWGGTYYYRLDTAGNVTRDLNLHSGQFCISDNGFHCGGRQPISGGLALTDDVLYIATSTIEEHDEDGTTKRVHLFKYQNTPNIVNEVFDQLLYEERNGRGSYVLDSPGRHHDMTVNDVLVGSGHIYLVSPRFVRIFDQQEQFVRQTDEGYHDGVITSTDEVYLFRQDEYDVFRGTEKIVEGGAVDRYATSGINADGLPSILYFGTEDELRYRAQQP